MLFLWVNSELELIRPNASTRKARFQVDEDQNDQKYGDGL